MNATNDRLIPAILMVALWLCGWASVQAGDVDALIAAGESKLKSGEIDAAIVDLRQAVAVDPASSRAQTRLGGALLLKQQNAAAIDAFRAAITLSANNADAFIGMAIAYLHSGDDALARAALEEAKRIDPTRAAKIDELIASIDQRAMSGGGH
jgi:cytochrome c-type biogenesis protein CcmH/NrfG